MKHATKEAIMQIPAAMLLFISWRTLESQQCRATGVNFENTAFAASAGLTC
jgi:hypothetical protein